MNFKHKCNSALIGYNSVLIGYNSALIGYNSALVGYNSSMASVMRFVEDLCDSVVSTCITFGLASHCYKYYIPD